MIKISSSKESGSVFVIVIAIFVLAIISGLGFIAWNNRQSNSTSQVANSTKSIGSNPNQAVATSPRYLTLNDWSVKFTLPTNLNLSDVYYYKTHEAEGPDYYGFTTNRVRAQGGACDNQVTGNLVTLNRATTKDGSGTLINSTAIGGYFYYSSSSIGDITPTPQCLLTNDAVQDRVLLDELVKSIMVQ